VPAKVDQVEQHLNSIALIGVADACENGIQATATLVALGGVVLPMYRHALPEPTNHAVALSACDKNLAGATQLLGPFRAGSLQ
jgi:hypothetical protein